MKILHINRKEMAIFLEICAISVQLIAIERAMAMILTTIWKILMPLEVPFSAVFIRYKLYCKSILKKYFYILLYSSIICV